jgi:hypothetical protein
MSDSIKWNVDQWTPEIVGWLYDEKDPFNPVEAAIFVDGIKLAQVRADGPRPDVEAAGYLTAWCGFRVPISEVVQDSDLHEVSIVNVRTGLEIMRLANRVCFNPARPILSESQRGKDSVLNVIGDKETFLNSVSTNKRLAVMSTFRAEGSFDGNARHLVQSLIESGFEVLVVDTSKQCPVNSLGAKLLIHRKNIGLDFASWNTGLDFLGISTASLNQLLLVNDSCYGPFSNLTPLFEEIDSIDADVVSLTDGWFGGYHLQSNFMLMKNEALNNSAVETFFESYGFPVLKSSIVREGEIGFSKALLASGHKLQALFSYESATKMFISDYQEDLRFSAEVEGKNYLHDQFSRQDKWFRSISDQITLGVPLNTTHALWHVLIKLGFPFVKKDLILKNQTGVPNLAIFEELIRSKFGFNDFGSIRNDIRLRGEVAVHLDSSSRIPHDD